MMYLLRFVDRQAIKGGSSEYAHQYHWKVGEAKPRFSDGNGFNDVCEVYADGSELVYIRKRYTNIPDCPTLGFMVWKPPFAQFIYDHLIYEPKPL